MTTIDQGPEFDLSVITSHVRLPLFKRPRFTRHLVMLTLPGPQRVRVWAVCWREKSIPWAVKALHAEALHIQRTECEEVTR